MTWRQWLTTLANAVISGAAAGIGGGVAGLTLKQALAVAGGCALVSAAKWIFQHPIPGATTD